MIEVLDIVKSFGAVQAVRGVRFEAADGQVTGLLGPNGAGKTTTLRMLYGLISADGGKVRVDGIEVAQRPLEARARMGVLPDAQGLYPRLSAREHIHYFGELQGLRGPRLKRRVDELIEALDMGAIAERRAAGFSQGERMKVALARALVHGPQNILLDEPTNGLDVMSTRAMRAQIQALKEAGKCVLFSSHIMQEVNALCDRVVIIACGKVVAEGTPDELRESAGIDDLEEVFVRLAGVEEEGEPSSDAEAKP